MLIVNRQTGSLIFLVCGSVNQKSYCGLDLHNQTTPDITKNGSYSAHVFTEEAVRLINQQVCMGMY